MLAVILAFVQGATAQELKVISFNIRYNSWDNIDGENGWPNRKAAVAKMINEERPAAIGLQEALIDHFFVRGLKVESFITLDGDYGVPYISDHYPIEMIIQL